MPVPAGPIAEGDRRGADRVDVALLRHRLRRDLLAAVPPDDVVEDVADVGRLVERRDHRADRVGTDRVTALDELDELVDDRARLGDPCLVPVERQPVPAQRDRAAEPLAQRVEHAVGDARELRGDLVRNGEHVLHAPQCRARRGASRARLAWLCGERCRTRALRRGLPALSGDGDARTARGDGCGDRLGSARRGCAISTIAPGMRVPRCRSGRRRFSGGCRPLVLDAFTARTPLRLAEHVHLVAWARPCARPRSHGRRPGRARGRYARLPRLTAVRRRAGSRGSPPSRR